MRRTPFVALLVGVALLSAGLLGMAGAVAQEQQQDRTLQRDAAQVASAFTSYFERARSLDLLLAQSPAFRPPGGRPRRQRGGEPSPGVPRAPLPGGDRRGVPDRRPGPRARPGDRGRRRPGRRAVHGRGTEPVLRAHPRPRPGAGVPGGAVRLAWTPAPGSSPTQPGSGRRTARGSSSTSRWRWPASGSTSRPARPAATSPWSTDHRPHRCWPTTLPLAGHQASRPSSRHFPARPPSDPAAHDRRPSGHRISSTRLVASRGRQATRTTG